MNAVTSPLIGNESDKNCLINWRINTCKYASIYQQTLQRLRLCWCMKTIMNERNVNIEDRLPSINATLLDEFYRVVDFDVLYQHDHLNSVKYSQCVDLHLTWYSMLLSLLRRQNEYYELIDPSAFIDKIIYLTSLSTRTDLTSDVWIHLGYQIILIFTNILNQSDDAIDFNITEFLCWMCVSRTVKIMPAYFSIRIHLTSNITLIYM